MGENWLRRGFCMLIGMISGLSVALAVLVCVLTGAFAGYSWLWILPVGFLSGFVLLAGLAFLFVYLMCKRVRLDESQEEDSPFYRAMANLCIEAALQFARVRVHTEGLEKTPKQGRFLLVCNHLHEADPAILLHFFRKSQLAFISKQENKDMFLVGKLMHKMLCQLINRENDREALKTILKCIQILKEDKASVAVFPEGYIREDRKFHGLRPGVFKIAQKANVPIVVCTIRDTHYVVKNFLKLKPSDVELHLLEVIPAEQLQGKTTVQISDYVHKIMADDLGPAYVPEQST